LRELTNYRRPPTIFERGGLVACSLSMLRLTWAGPPRDKPPKPNCSKDTEQRGRQKVYSWASSPKRSAEERTGRHNAVADEVIGTIGAGAKMRRRLRDNECFACRLAKFFQPSHDKSDGQPSEVVGQQ